MKAKILIATLALFAAVSISSAQNQKSTTTKTETKKSCYVDANNNNVCDNYENKTCTKGNGKGLMDGSGKGKGKCNRNGYGNGHRNGRCCGQAANSQNKKGPNYVDANKNGICDNRETAK